MIKWLSVAGMIIFSSLAFGYDQYQAARAMGMYLAANDILIRLNHSECSYVLKKKPQSMQRAFDDAMTYLTPRDQIEFRKYYESEEFKMKALENQKIVNTTIKAFEQDYDKKTACGLAVGSLAQTARTGNEAWINFVKANRLQPSK